MTTPTATLTISRETFEQLARRAAQSQRTADELADELLRAETQPTEHPYIVRREGFRGGRPILRGSSMPVWLVAAMWRSGDTADDILRAYPHLEPAAVYDAISYYLDHRAEIEAQIEENRIERALKDTGATMNAEGVITFPHE